MPIALGVLSANKTFSVHSVPAKSAGSRIQSQLTRHRVHDLSCVILAQSARPRVVTAARRARTRTRVRSVNQAQCGRTVPNAHVARSQDELPTQNTQHASLAKRGRLLRRIDPNASRVVKARILRLASSARSAMSQALWTQGCPPPAPEASSRTLKIRLVRMRNSSATVSFKKKLVRPQTKPISEFIIQRDILCVFSLCVPFSWSSLIRVYFALIFAAFCASLTQRDSKPV